MSVEINRLGVVVLFPLCQSGFSCLPNIYAASRENECRSCYHLKKHYCSFQESWADFGLISAQEVFAAQAHWMAQPSEDKQRWLEGYNRLIETALRFSWEAFSSSLPTIIPSSDAQGKSWLCFGLSGICTVVQRHQTDRLIEPVTAGEQPKNRESRLVLSSYRLRVPHDWELVLRGKVPSILRPLAESEELGYAFILTLCMVVDKIESSRGGDFSDFVDYLHQIYESSSLSEAVELRAQLSRNFKLLYEDRYRLKPLINELNDQAMMNHLGYAWGQMNINKEV
jgi:hypothetical protein